MKILLLTSIYNPSESGSISSNNVAQAIDKDILVMIGLLIGIALISFTILSLIKFWMEYRLKNKLISSGLSETIINSILQKSEKGSRKSTIKWFAIFAGLGFAFTIINYTLPLGMHSVAILAFCLAVSFISYFFFLKMTDKS
ncbi:hypothetical protein [Chryseobacterium sp. M5A1_1a]